MLLVIFCLFSLLFAVLVCFLLWCRKYEAPEVFSYDNRPSLFVLYVKGLLLSFSRKQGVLSSTPPTVTGSGSGTTSTGGGDGDRSHENTDGDDGRNCKVTVTGCRIDPERLAAYGRVCGFSDAADAYAVLPTYLESFFMPLFAWIATSKKFRLSPLGLIHLKQRLKTPCSRVTSVLHSAFTVECSVDRYRTTDRGVEVDVLMLVIDTSQEVVWEGTATLLSRHKHKPKAGEHRRQHSSSTLLDSDWSEAGNADVAVQKDLGLRYARVSGDWNPHHLYPWTARLLGYKAPIPHGMWTLSKALSLIHESSVYSSKSTIDVNVSFKRPIFLPGVSLFSWGHLLNDTRTIHFRVKDKTVGVPQLIGSVALT